MKWSFLAGFLLSMSLQVLGFSGDTTVTSFEIHLKRKSSGDAFGFNTCTIDRERLYRSVIHELKNKIACSEFCSIHDPMVLLRYQEYVSAKESQYQDSDLTSTEREELIKTGYDYFVRITGTLQMSTPLNPFQKASFRLKVIVFDKNGNLVAKSRSHAAGKKLNAMLRSTEDPITETEFIDLVTEAATQLKLGI